SSAPGLAVITAVFSYGTDPYRARQLVIERLALVATALPAGVQPAVAPLASALTTIVAVGLRGDASVSALALRDIAQWTIRPRLLAVPGVADVVVYGGGVRRLEITTTPERLWAARATLDDLVAAAHDADATAGSGFVDRVGQRLPTWFEGRVRTPEDLARAPLPNRDGVPLPGSAGAGRDPGGRRPRGHPPRRRQAGRLLPGHQPPRPH